MHSRKCSSHLRGTPGCSSWASKALCKLEISISRLVRAAAEATGEVVLGLDATEVALARAVAVGTAGRVHADVLALKAG